jgi:branched-subunit amino acid aminotransferase/4-amino-4-deoxychorismate lyase
MYCYCNGALIPLAEAQVGVTDLAVIRGFGIFDYFLFENYQPRFLDDYLNRFYRSADFLDLTIPLDKKDFAEAIYALIRKNGQPEGGIRLLLTGGYALDGYTPPTSGNLFILQGKRPHLPDQQTKLGVAVATYQHQRELPEIKSINYLTGIKLQPWLRQQGADYLLYHDGTYFRESDRSNFFIVNPEGVILTPKDKILHGITRMKVIELARQLGLPLEEREVTLAELRNAREAFLTSSLKAALPVRSIDGQPVGDGKPGAITLRLQQAFGQLVRTAY